MKKTWLVAVIGSAFLSANAIANTNVTISGPHGFTQVVLNQAYSVAPVAMYVEQGKNWKGFRGTVSRKDGGKAIAYRFRLKDGFHSRGETVTGLLPIHDHSAGIRLRPGVVPAVNG